MLFFLRGQENGSIVYLLKNKEYVVGRKDCDILIEKDQSISRKHAVLTVKDDKVILCDCGSRYNTFVDNTKLEANTEVMLTRGNVIRFGRLQSFYTFNETNILTTTSSIKSNQKAILKNNINFLGGSLAQNWNPQCTHVTIEEIVLTVKVLCAIISGTPIVKLKYWDDYVDCVKQNLSPPDVASYKPPCSEVVLNYQNLSLEFREERKGLFKNKIFIFPTKEEKARMVDMINLAGGEAISFDVNPITRAIIKNSSKEYLIMLTDTQPSAALQDIMNYIDQLGKRTIPLQEIALAIITCSCEKDCNPNFDRKGTVLQAKTQTQKHSAKILVQETQSQDLLAMGTENVKNETIIPTSMELDLDLNTHTVIHSSLNATQEWLTHSKPQAEETITSVKREGDSMESLKAAKKIKIEPAPTPLFSKSSKQRKDVKSSFDSDNEPTREDERPLGKTLFAFKKPNNENADPEPKNVVINPFAKKRKAAENDDENPPKKSAPANNSTTSPLPSTSKSVETLKENPFSQILRSKNSSKSPDVATTSKSKLATKKKQNFASSTLVNEQISSLQVDLSAIEAVTSTFEKSFGWISKSINNQTGNKQTSRINGSADEPEEELIRYIESFKNTIVVMEESMVIKKPTPRDNNNDSSMVNNNLKNFKKFKKVQPLKIQTTIIPEAKYQNVVCNEKCSIPVVREDSEDENDIDTQNNTAKRKGKQFAF